ncbi:hypothetical protein M8C21_010458 [Ambrosia artemisiifolia]|uniref:LOB domain-containing protein n=1 Tax=Ambrosia artemisiifolia TaxID=4212 RepID=A0AAD5CBQ0_AMBAR|nr:hypothetical protein M8C21_010458 [Ambrosia artemisiifolia]
MSTRCPDCVNRGTQCYPDCPFARANFTATEYLETRKYNNIDWVRDKLQELSKHEVEYYKRSILYENKCRREDPIGGCLKVNDHVVKAIETLYGQMVKIGYNYLKNKKKEDDDEERNYLIRAELKLL